MHNIKLKVNCLRSMCLLGKLNVLNSQWMKVQFVLSGFFVFGRLKWKFLHQKIIKSTCSHTEYVLYIQMCHNSESVIHYNCRLPVAYIGLRVLVDQVNNVKVVNDFLRLTSLAVKNFKKTVEELLKLWKLTIALPNSI